MLSHQLHHTSCRERQILTSLISSPIMTQPRSLSGVPEDLSMPASPLVSSMVCAASMANRHCCSAEAPHVPSLEFSFTPSISLAEVKESPGETQL